jgi:signal transduction histidine kinase
MGLGLAIVKQILKLHNSFLRIESKEHQGSSFSFELSLDLMPNVESETYSLTI